MFTALTPGLLLTGIFPYLHAAELELIADPHCSPAEAHRVHAAACYLSQGYALPYCWDIWDMLDPVDATQVYRTQGNHCTCPEWTLERPCLHLLVVALAHQAAQIAEDNRVGILHLAQYRIHSRHTPDHL
jgi:hypothetical protein